MNNIIKVFRYFGLRIDKRETIRQISLDTKIPYMTLNRIIKKIEKQNLIITERIGKSFVCSINKNNLITKHYLIIASEYFKNEFIEKNPLIKKICEIIEGRKTKKLSVILLDHSQQKGMEIVFVYESEEMVKGIKQELKEIEKIGNFTIKYVGFTKEGFKEVIKKKDVIALRIFKEHIVLHNPEIFWNSIYEVLE